MRGILTLFTLAVLLLSSCVTTSVYEETVVVPAPASPIEFRESDVEIVGDLKSFIAATELREVSEGVRVLTLRLTSPTAAVPPEFSLKWKTPAVDVQGIWTPRISLDKATFWVDFTSRAAAYAPVVSLFNNCDFNRLTFACSDAQRSLEISSYIVEEDGTLQNSITFFKERSPALKEYVVEIRIDTRPVPLWQALRDVGEWWAEREAYKPAPVPDAAKKPMYSTWYSFHQGITADEVVRQCEIGRDLGLTAVIVDDGWQTLDSGRGYAYTGDWKPERIPDMKAFVDRVHALGMKFLLWYSVALVGEKSETYERLEGKYLRYWEGQGAYVLDPRFPEVRDYIIGTYEKALREWDLDGFKLDFIGMFRPDEKTVFEASGGRDFASIDDAVDRLMTDIMARLRRIEPEIMIEFRQPYIGPLMRKYGNMFRATDCPDMALVNRVRTADIRLLCGETAVHSDMFMWHPDEAAEEAALQILNILFAVPQLSVRLDQVSDGHRRMIGFWIGYWNDNRDVLLGGSFMPERPAANYPLIKAALGGRMIVALYEEMAVTLREAPRKLDVVNAKRGRGVIVDLARPMGRCSIRVFDCRGTAVRDDTATLEKGLHKFDVPASGLLEIEQR